MFRKMHAGSTGQAIPIFVQDTSSTAGAGLGSLAFNTSGLVAQYRRQGESTWTPVALQAMTLGTWASGGFVSDGGVTGGYEFGIPDAALAAGAEWAEIEIYGAPNMLPVLIFLELDAANYQSATNLGLSALPTANPGASGGLPTVGTGAGQFNPSGGKVPATVAAADVSGNLPVADSAGVTGIVAKLPANNIADETLVIAATNSILTAVGSPMQAGSHVQLATTQDQYAPAKAGDAMTLTGAYDFAKGTVAMTESYPASGAVPTPAEGLLTILQYLTNFAISGTTYQVKKVDKATNAFAVTLNDATSPTGASR